MTETYSSAPPAMHHLPVGGNVELVVNILDMITSCGHGIPEDLPV